MKKSYALLLLIIPATIYAQDKELFSLSYKYAPVHYNDTAANTRSLDVHAGFPLLVKNRQVLAGGIGYRQLDFHNFPTDFRGPLYQLSLKLAWLYRISEKHDISLFAQGVLGSDMKDLSWEDNRFAGGFRYVTRQSERFKYGLGVGYANQFFGNQLAPFIELDYRISDKLKMYGQLPVRYRLEYNVADRANLGWELNMEVSSYRLSATKAASGFIRTAAWVSNIYYEYRFYKKWQFNMQAGLALKQTYELYEQGERSGWSLFTIRLGDKPRPVQSVERRGLQLQAGITYTL